MKKFLFIALLSLVTLGAKAYDVIFINNTLCQPIRMTWQNETRFVNGTTTITNLSSANGDIIQVVADNSSCCGVGQGGGLASGSFGFSTSQASGFVISFQLRKCGIVTSYYVVTVSYDSSTDTYTVEIS